MSVSFRLDGQDFIALNGGPAHSFTEAISLYVDCKDQREVDRLWRRLVRGGKPSRCGWLQDKFGLWWQIIPRRLPQLLRGRQSAQVMEAMLKMVKIDVAELERAARGRERRAARPPGPSPRAATS
jgi:predicted 3-demethylubiquinone-9 3-methyltransferase (glyoxalase superfamily)